MRNINVNSKAKEARVGVKAPGFLVKTADGRFPLHQLAARHQRLILTSQDSYRYHPN